MSESPPPFGEDETTTKVDAPVDIDLNDDDKPSTDAAAAAAPTITTTPANDDSGVGNSASNTNTATRNNNDELFFSTISDPEPNPESKNTSKTEDMDEIFRANKPQTTTTATNGIEEDDDDPFSPNNQRNSDRPASEVKPPSSPPVLQVSAPSVVGGGSTSSSEQVDRASKVSPKRDELTDLTETLQKQSIGASKSLYTSLSQDEDDEDRDKFLNIVLSDPHKIGDGMSAYMVYKITTTTNFPMFKSKEFSTNRRFSDFLSLYEKLKEKHLPAGRILPPAPEKDMLGMAKVKMSKEDQSPGEFIGKRRAALERFLMRLAKHKSFRYDPDFRDFLEIGDDLPRASNTSALSGAGMLKMFKNVTDSVTKIAFKMEETDQWFEEKSRQVENLYVQYKKLHSMIDLLYGWRKDLATSVKDFSKSIAILSNSEEQLPLSRALSHLGEVYEKIDAIYMDEANSDYFNFGELVKDYVCLFDNVKEVFYQRIKTFGMWQKAEETLKSKKDAKAKLEAANKQDKLPAALAEIKEWETKVEKSKDDFEQISKTIKEEVKRFDLVRANEFRVGLTNYVEKLYNNQESIVKLWEQYLPEVKAI